MHRIGKTEDRRLNPNEDFTFQSTTAFARAPSPQEPRVSCMCSSVKEPPRNENEDDEEPEKAPHDFTFTEYSPICYGHVRSFFGVNSESLGHVLRCRRWHSTPSPGKSSAHIFFCDMWVIKTMTQAESEFLRRILHRYYFHVRDNPATFLPHFVGHYKVRIGLHSTRLFVMQNVFATQLSINRIYDLKGSTVGRFVSTTESQRSARMLKDLDLNTPIRIGKERKALLLKQLAKDAYFLKQCNIMDYSLLVGIHEVSGCTRFSGALSSSDEGNDAAAEYHRAHQYAISNQLTAEGSAIVSSINPGFPNEIYFIGVIDILQNYSLFKRLENAFVGIKYSRRNISCVPPPEYADRFLSFISSIIV